MSHIVHKCPSLYSMSGAGGRTCNIGLNAGASRLDKRANYLIVVAAAAGVVERKSFALLGSFGCALMRLGASVALMSLNNHYSAAGAGAAAGCRLMKGLA